SRNPSVPGRPLERIPSRSQAERVTLPGQDDNRHGGTMTDSSAQRVALVTGASSGIGLTIARHLASQGLRTYLCARDDHRLAETVKSLQDDGFDVDGTTCDVAKPEEIRQFVRSAVDRY